MKQLAIALMLGALPATALAQDLACLACDHIVPYYWGNGGFIGTVAQDADEVTFVASCGSVTVTGEATIHGDTASQLFNHGNGLRCDRDDGTFEIAGLEDGGWYWINDRWSSAVGNVISVDVLDNETVEITDPGDSVSISEGMGAVFLKQGASGRIGLLPNILPVPEVDLVPVNYCGYSGAGTTASPYARKASSCMLGNGSSFIRAQGEADPFTSERDMIMDGATVTRPKATGATVVISYDLWLDPGSHVTDSAATGNAIVIGQAGAAGASPLTATFSASAATAGPTAVADIADAGLAIANAASVGTLTISPNTTYCGGAANNDHSVTVTIAADATSVDEVTPAVAENDAATVAATHKITVVCP